MHQLYNRILVLFVLTLSLNVHGQIRAIDKLEVLYDQGHYAMVYRKAKRLLDKPDFDFSMQPEFYKSLALFRLSKQSFWSKMHPDALQEARKLFFEVKASPEGLKVFYAHIEHVSALRKDLIAWVEYLKSTGDTAKYDEVQQILFGLFDHVPDLDNPANYTQPVLVEGEGKEIVETADTKRKREEIVSIAKKHLGTPYQWAGVAPGGFDCSGFTTYVHQQFNKELPRRAEEQYRDSRKVKQRYVQKGDLVFFNNGAGISHVGIIISEKGAPLVMIHASSSKGIIITEIETSEYWLKRLYGFGSYLN